MFPPSKNFLLCGMYGLAQTPAIRDMADRFASKDYFGVYESLASSLSGLTVRGPDIALLGNVGGLVDSLGDFGYGGSIPRGTKTFVKNLSKVSLERLSVSEDVSVDIRGKRLLAADAETDPGPCNCVGDDSGVVSASVRSFNVLTSSLSFLEGLTEVDMMKLQQLFARMTPPSQGIARPVGLSGRRFWTGGMRFRSTGRSITTLG